MTQNLENAAEASEVTTTEAVATAPAAEAGAQPLHFIPRREYFSKSVFEMPNAPQILLEAGELQLTPAIQVAVSRLDELNWLVSLSTSITGIINGKVAYALQLKRDAVFELANASNEVADNLLFIQAPHLLFAAVRSEVDGLLVRGGLQPAGLFEPNWVDLYVGELNRRAAEASAAAPAENIDGDVAVNDTVDAE